MIAPAAGDSVMPPMVTAPRRTVPERAISWQPVGRYRTLWVFSGTAFLMLLLAALLRALSPLEHALFAGPAISDEPFWTLMVVLTLPHNIIATVFMSTSKRWQANRGRLLATALLGLGIAGLLYAMGGLEKGWRSDLVIVYFLAHVYRDEWRFYRRHCGRELAAFRPWLLPAALYSALLAVWWTVYVVITKDPARSICDDANHCLLAGHGKAAIWLPLFTILCVVAQHCLRRFVREGNASFKMLLLRDAPLYWVYALIPVIGVGCLALGARLYSVVLLHVIGWWLFATMGYARTRQPVNLRASTWYWLRNTQAGFQTLHAALVILFCALMVYVHHTSSQGTAIAWALGRDPVYYFTIMHVTMSFARESH